MYYLLAAFTGLVAAQALEGATAEHLEGGNFDVLPRQLGVVAPVAQIAGPALPVVAPIINPALPVVNPAVQAVESILNPIVSVVDPVVSAVDPVINALVNRILDPSSASSTRSSSSSSGSSGSSSSSSGSSGSSSSSSGSSSSSSSSSRSSSSRSSTASPGGSSSSSSSVLRTSIGTAISGMPTATNGSRTMTAPSSTSLSSGTCTPFAVSPPSQQCASAPGTCPACDGSLVSDGSGSQYLLKCAAGLCGGRVIPSTPGSRVAKRQGITTLGACQAACDAVQACAAIIFTPGDGSCVLVDGTTTGFSFDPNTIALVKYSFLFPPAISVCPVRRTTTTTVSVTYTQIIYPVY